MQNLILLIELIRDAWLTPMKAANMILNRFCIDEDAAFELSGVHYLETTAQDIIFYKGYDQLRKIKGKEYSFFIYFNKSYVPVNRLTVKLFSRYIP